MLPSVISNFIWGYGSAESEEDSGQLNEADFDHSTSDEPGDWLLITCEKPGRCAGETTTHTQQKKIGLAGTSMVRVGRALNALRISTTVKPI